MTATEETSSAGVVAFVFAILGISGMLPCIGPIVAVVAGSGDRTSLGRAGVVIGWITLGIYALVLALLAVAGVVALIIGIASN